MRRAIYGMRKEGLAGGEALGGGNYKAGLSVEGSSWTARSSLAIRMARISQAQTFDLAPLFLPRPAPFFSISRERR